jgi:hypothetical protein
VRTLGRFETIDDVANLILARRGDSIVRLSDVASVRLHHAELRNLSYAGGQRTLNLSVLREPGSNVIAIKRAMTVVVEDLNRSRLAQNGLELRLSMTTSVRRGLGPQRVPEPAARRVAGDDRDVPVPAFMAGHAGRRARHPDLHARGVPRVCCSGRTINVISLAGIAFAIGMTVDNTIVVLENIERAAARRHGAPAGDVLTGVREVWPAVLASTLTTVLVLVPIVFVDEEAGQLFSDVAIAISAAILASMFVASRSFRPRWRGSASPGARSEVRDGRARQTVLAESSTACWRLAARRRALALGHARRRARARCC